MFELTTRKSNDIPKADREMGMENGKWEWKMGMENGKWEMGMENGK